MSERKLKKIVRAEALEDFSSAELLDQLLVVVGSKAWILLLILSSVLAAAIVWGFLGKVPIMIEGEGIIVERNAPLVVENPTANGAVVETPIKPGDVVEAGGLLVAIGNPAMETQLRTAKADWELLEQNNITAKQREEAILKKEQEAVSRQQEATLATLDRTRKLIDLYQQQVKEKEELANKKLIPMSELIATRATLFQAEETEKSNFSMLAQLESTFATQEQSITLARQERTEAIERASMEVQRLDTQLASAQHVYAPLRCRVVEIHVSQGSFVAPGDPIATVLPLSEAANETDGTDAPIVVVGFVPYGKGKELEPGMVARVGVPFAPTTQYGFIKGKVGSIASFASDEESVARLVGSEVLAKSILADTGVPLEVKLELQTDSSSKSGLAWTSADGFPGAVPSLSECSIQITIRSERPISLIIPWLKKKLGFDVVGSPSADHGPSG